MNEYRVYHKDPITLFLASYSPWWCHSQSYSWFYYLNIDSFKSGIICSNIFSKRCSKESKQKINLLSECILSQLTVNETWFSCDFWTCNCQRTSSYQNSNILVATMVCFESCKSKYHRKLAIFTCSRLCTCTLVTSINIWLFWLTFK